MPSRVTMCENNWADCDLLTLVDNHFPENDKLLI